MISARAELAGLLRQLSASSCEALGLVAARITTLEAQWAGLDHEERTKRLSQLAADRNLAARRRAAENAEDVAEAAAISILAIALSFE